jgi:hypothetical protein
VPAERQAPVAWIVFVEVVIFVTLALALPRPAPAPRALSVPHVLVPTGASGFERALAAAREGRMQAREAVKRAMQHLEEEDPAGAAAMDAEAWRRGLVAADRGGVLSRALRAARRANTLVSNPEEASRVAELRVMLECEAGHHQEELRQAQKVAGLQRRNWRSLTILLRAARCNEQEELVRQLSAELDVRGK